MYKLFRLFDCRAGECVGAPLVFISRAEASIWLDKQKLHPDLYLKQIGIINDCVVETCDPVEIPVNAYALDDEE